MSRSAVARRWIYPEAGDIIRVHGWPHVARKRFLVAKVSDGLIVHAFELEPDQTRGKLRSFDIGVVEVLR
ncbi:MAG: hypothetical protein ACT4PO_01785 [Actinomycetota bacterium]